MRPVDVYAVRRSADLDGRDYLARRRAYGGEAVCHLRFVRRGRELGFSLDDVRSLATLAEGGRHCGEVRALTLQHLAEVNAKIRDLRRHAPLGSLR